ncbi:Fic family protein [Candidatus Micrarchaeota archaeon]|nr:Fic family protein [Candidatus Micrarchaeota archaeon]
MKSKWDVLFALFELKKARLSVLAEKVGSKPSSVRQRLAQLLRESLVSQEARGLYEPMTDSARVWSIFSIMKFCRNRGVNYNFFLTREFANVVQVASGKEEVLLADFKHLNYRTARKYLAYLSMVNLLFIVSKKPLAAKLVREPVFEDVLSLFGLKKKEKQAGKPAVSNDSYKEIENLLAGFKALEKGVGFADVEEQQKIEFTSASTQLEGNTFTLEQSKDLILHDIVPADKKLKEANEVKNYYSAVNYLLAHLNEPLSIQFVIDLHRIIVFNSGVREGFRSANVSIQGNPFYKVSYFSEILPKLEELCRKINEFLSKKRGVKETVKFASFVYNEFQHIHPFEDGNSRATRLVWNYVLLRRGFPLINIYSNARQEYLSLTKLARERNDAKLNSFLAAIIKDNLYKLTRA